MSNTFACLYLHAVWSTKNRAPLISSEIESHIYHLITNIIVNEHKGRVFAINGMPDHVHLFFSIAQTVSIPKLMQSIKAKSSLLVHENFPNTYFAWQSGYGIFSVSVSMNTTVKNYVLSQKEHHQKFSFEEEYFGLLKKHGIIFDSQYVLG